MPADPNELIKMFQGMGLDEDTAFLYATSLTDPSMAQDVKPRATAALSGSLTGRYTGGPKERPVVRIKRHELDANGEGISGIEILPEPNGINYSMTHPISVRQPSAPSAPPVVSPPTNPLDPAKLGKPVLGSGWPGSAEWPTVPYAVDAQHKKMLGEREKASAAKMLQEYVMAQDKLRAAELGKQMHTQNNAYLAAQGNAAYAAQNNPALMDNPNPWGGTNPDQYLRDVGLSPLQVFASPGPRK